MKKHFTNSNIAALKPRPDRYEVTDAAFPGLTVRVSPDGIKAFYLRIRTQDSKQIRLRIGPAHALTVAQARDLARGAMVKVHTGQDIAADRKKPKTASLRDFLDAIYHPFMTTHWKSGFGQVQRIRSTFSLLLDRPMTAISAFDIEKIRSARIKQGLSPATCNRDTAAIRAAFNYAFKRGIIPTNPLRDVSMSKEDTKGRVRFLTDAERKRLLDALDERQEQARLERHNANAWRTARHYPPLPDLSQAKFTDHLKPLVLLALNTGMRRGELFNLQWRDIAFDRNMLTVEGKGAKTTATRHIPLNATARNTLLIWRDQHPHANPTDLVFPGEDHRRLNNIAKAWRNLLTRANIEAFRFHDCRHDAASQLVMRGVDLAVVREILGHSNISMTLRYSHLSPETKAAAMRKLDEPAPVLRFAHTTEPNPLERRYQCQD